MNTTLAVLLMVIACLGSWLSAHRAANAVSRAEKRSALLQAELSSQRQTLATIERELATACGCGYLERVRRARVNLDHLDT